MAHLLKGHVSRDTAYVVPDYPYGYRQRCQMRYWLEYKRGFGVRLVTQTSNPNEPGAWNRPKTGIYFRFGASLYLDEKGHVKVAGVTEYDDTDKLKAFLEEYGDGLQLESLYQLTAFIAAKVAYDDRVADDQ